MVAATTSEFDFALCVSAFHKSVEKATLYIVNSFRFRLGTNKFLRRILNIKTWWIDIEDTKTDRRTEDSS